MESSRSVANYFISKSFWEGRSVSPVKVIKLVYLAHGWSLGIYGRPLIGDGVEAWEYGPMIRGLYDDLKKYGNGPVTSHIQVYVPGLRGGGVIPEVVDTSLFPLLDRVWGVYKDFTAGQLCVLSHCDGSPWDKTYNPRHGVVVIPERVMGDYFKVLYEQNIARSRQ